MKFEAKEIFAILIVLLLPLGMGQFVQKSTLPEYGAAVQIKSALAGGEVQPHIAAAAALEKIYAALTGMPADSAQAIVGFLLIFAPILLSLSSLMLYFACRQLAYTRAQSAFAALLFSLSITATISFLPGTYGSSQFATLLFCAFLVPFAAFIHKPSRMEMLCSAVVLGFAAGYVNAIFALAGIAAVVAFAFAHQKKKEEKNYLAMLGALAIMLAIAGFLSPDKSFLSFTPEGVAQIATGAPFLFAAAAICIGLYFFGSRDSEYLALVVLGALLFGFSPLSGALLLVLAAAEGMAKMMAEASEPAKLSAAFACGFFIIMGLVYGTVGAYGAIAASVLLGLLSPLCLHFYDNNARAIFSVMGASLLLLSLFFALFAQLPPTKAGYPSYTDASLAEAMTYLSGAGIANLATLERVDALAFYLPGVGRERAADVEKLLLSGNSSLPSGTRLLLSLSSLEQLSEKGGFEVYYYAQNYTNTDSGTTYALFVSSQGRLVTREILAGGKLALKDGAALDSYGRYYAPISLPRMVMLSDSKPISDKANRMLVMEEGGAPPRAVAIYSGKDSAIKLDKEFSGTAVYKVN